MRRPAAWPRLTLAALRFKDDGETPSAEEKEAPRAQTPAASHRATANAGLSARPAARLREQPAGPKWRRGFRGLRLEVPQGDALLLFEVRAQSAGREGRPAAGGKGGPAA